MKKLAELYLTFAKIGLFTFGGGYAMLPLIEHTCITQKKWITEDDMLTITLMGESTPGPIAVNCSTYVGNRQKGFAGSLAATLGMITPSFIIIMIISMFFERFIEIKWVAGAFQGIKVAVGILIIDAGIRLLKKVPKKALPVGITLFTFSAMLTINILSVRFTSVILLLIAAIVSVTFYYARNGGKAK